MNNATRTVIGGVVLALMGLGVAIVIPATPALVWANVGALMVAVLVLVLVTLFVLEDESKGPQVFVFPILAWQFLICQVVLAVVTVGLDVATVWTAPWALVVVGHAIILGTLVILMLGTSAGKVEIEQTETQVKTTTFDWKALVAEIAIVRSRTPASISEAQPALKALEALHDAFRYSDPMANPSVEALDEGLRRSILDLGPAVDALRWDDVVSMCQSLQKGLEERKVLVRALK